MTTARVDLDIVQALNGFLESHRNPVGSAERESVQRELALIESRLRESVASDFSTSNEGRHPLKSLFDKHPSLLSEVSIQTIKEVICFALGCCNHYSEIRSCREFTEEERQVGRELTICVNAAQELLEGLRRKSE